MSESNESQRRDSSGGRNRNRNRNRSRNRNRNREGGFSEGNGNRDRDRDRGRNRSRTRRPRVTKREATVFEKILEFVTFGLWKPDLIIHAVSNDRTDEERKPARDRDEGKAGQQPQMSRRERDAEGSGDRERGDRGDRERGERVDRDRGERVDRDRPAREKRPPEPAEVTTERLYVGNLDYETTEADLYDLFNGVGKVKDAEVVCHKYTQRSKGYAFVVMSTVEEAKRAVAVLNNKPFMSRELWVSGAKSTGPKDQEESSVEDTPPAPAAESESQEEEQVSGTQAVA